MAQQTQTLPTLRTAELGRTRRHVTTFGLGGQGSLMLTPPGVDAVAIIEKAYRLGVTYFDTSNVYGPSQGYYGKAFRKLGLVPGESGYDAKARERIYLASKTHMRTSRHPQGQRWVSDFSQGMGDGVGVETAPDDVRRSLTQIFGDGKGGYPPGAYLDCVQLHNVTCQDEVDMIFRGFEDPRSNHDWLGALIGLLDLREGTNRSGTNPRHEKLVRHVGITGHWSSPALMYAIQRDHRRVLDTLLTAVNPGDPEYLGHQHNVLPVAKAAGMGVIAMKVFAEGTYYGKPPHWASDPNDVYLKVSSDRLPSAPLIHYALSVPGVDICIIGIGRIDPSDDPAKCQLVANIAAAQHRAMSPEQRAELEAFMSANGFNTANGYFQRGFLGLTPPRNPGAEADTYGFSPGLQHPGPAVRITWDTAYAGNAPVARYDILRDGLIIGSVPHVPLAANERFSFRDQSPYSGAGGCAYTVRAVDAVGRVAESPPFRLFSEALDLADAVALQWRQTQQPLKLASADVPGQPGHVVGSGESSGAAFFTGGEVASVAVAYTIDFVNGSGSHTTYARYLFEDGSSFMLRGQGRTTASPDGSTAGFVGQCRFVEGTGRFRGIRGGGAYTGKRLAPLASGAITYLDYRANYARPPEV